MTSLEDARKLLEEREKEVCMLETRAAAARQKLIEDKKTFAALRDGVTSLVQSNSTTLGPIIQAGPNVPWSSSEHTVLIDSAGRLDLSELTKNSGVIRRAVIEAVEWMPTQIFSTRDVLTYLRLNHPLIEVESNRSNINGYLRDLIEEDKLELVEEGSGQRPNKYLKR